jgi:hypothetical protein
MSVAAQLEAAVDGGDHVPDDVGAHGYDFSVVDGRGGVRSDSGQGLGSVVYACARRDDQSRKRVLAYECHSSNWEARGDAVYEPRINGAFTSASRLAAVLGNTSSRE